jgi:hypothetical protein
MKELAAVKSKINQLPLEDQKEMLDLLLELENAKEKEASREDFLSFVKKMWPAFIGGKHHEIMADAFERVANGDLKRLIINMPPRHTKSEKKKLFKLHTRQNLL